MSPESIADQPEHGSPGLDGWPVPTREVMRSLESPPVWGTAAAEDGSPATPS